jgi:hypothetical protein
LKKPTGSVWFWFLSLEPKKPNRTRIEKTGKKPSQTEKTEPNRKKTEPNRKNRAKPVFVLKNQIELNRNRSV